jgi:hypothetical protein
MQGLIKATSNLWGWAVFVCDWSNPTANDCTTPITLSAAIIRCIWAAKVRHMVRRQRELSVGVRSSETIALRHPIMPVGDGFSCRVVVGINSRQL